MEPYRVGALADLISSSKPDKNDDKKKSKKKKSLGDLFTSRLPEPEPVIEIIPKSENGSPGKDKKKPKKRKSEKGAEKSVDNTVVDENAVPKTKKKKVTPKKEVADNSDDDDEAPEFTRPSLRYQVLNTLI
jgi:hypothetical protein